MFFTKTFFLSLVVFLLFAVQGCSGKVSKCTSGCTIDEDELCSLILRIDYTNSYESFASISGLREALLVLTNGEPLLNELTSIKCIFNE